MSLCLLGEKQFSVFALLVFVSRATSGFTVAAYAMNLALGLFQQEGPGQNSLPAQFIHSHAGPARAEAEGRHRSCHVVETITKSQRNPVILLGVTLKLWL